MGLFLYPSTGGGEKERDNKRGEIERKGVMEGREKEIREKAEGGREAGRGRDEKR